MGTPVLAADIVATDASSLSAAISSAGAGDRILIQNDIALGTTLLPPVSANITIEGNGHTIDGQGNNRILFVNSSATIQNVTLANGAATGGAGGGSPTTPGGGGLGAGGALFVNSGSLTLSGVTFSNNSATGGRGGAAVPYTDGTPGGGGGGGLGGGGGGGGQDSGGGGGGYSGGGGGAGGSTDGTRILNPGAGGSGPGGNGGSSTAGQAGGNGVNGGVGGAATAITFGPENWTMGGGGGGGGTNGGNGGDGSSNNVNGGGGGGGGGLASGSGGNGGTQTASPNGTNGTTGGGGGGAAAGGSSSGNGGDFGGGGGGSFNASGGSGGFGGGGGGSGYGSSGGNGGFGGGGGSTKAFAGSAGTGGVGGGNADTGDAAGGAAFGGAVFVRSGASITIADGSFSGGAVTGGLSTIGAASGAAAGSGLFLMNGTTTTFNPTGTLTVNGTIADDSAASVPTGGTFTAGSGAGAAITIAGGTVALNGANTYSGGTTLTGGTAAAGNASAFGTGTVTFNGGALSAGVDNMTIANGIAFNPVTNTIDTNGMTLTLSGVIADGSGVGGLTKSGTGTLVLSGANTYTGDTTLTAGTVRLANNAALGTGSLSVTGGGIDYAGGVSIGNTINLQAASTQLQVSSGTATQSGSILETTSGRSLEKIGAGTLIVNSLNNSGATTVTAGTLAGGASNAFSAQSAFTVATGATLDINGLHQTVDSLAGAGTVTNNGGADAIFQVGTVGVTTASTTFSGAITDGATNKLALEVQTSGILTLTGANTYSAGTLICDCSTLQVGNGGTSGSIVGDVVNNNLLIFNRSDASSFAGAISDGLGHAGSVEKKGAGTLTLTGASSYTGPTSVLGGTLQVDGSIVSATTVASGATLAGSGGVGNVTVNSGASLNPGAVGVIGTMTVTGNLTFNGASNYVVFMNPTLASTTNVSGTAALSGTVYINGQTGVSYRAGSFTILTATGGLGGTTFGTLNVLGTFGSGVRNPRLVYDANHVYFVLDAGTITTDSSFSGNNNNVANGINTAILGGASPNSSFATLLGLSGSQMTAALNQIAGQTATGGTTGGMQMMNSFLSLLLNPYGGAPGGNPGTLGFARSFGPGEKALSPEAAAAYAAVTPKDKRVDSFGARWGMWGQAYGGYNTTGGDAGAGTNDTTTRTWGLAAGADYRVAADTTLGFSLGGGAMNWGLSDGLGSGKSDVFQFGVYGSHSFGAAYASAALSYAYHRMTTDRTVTVGTSEQLRADFNAHGFGGRLETGYRFAAQPVAITPYAALQMQNFRTPAYNEYAVSGPGAFALSYGSRSTTATRLELGAWFDKVYVLDSGNALSLRARAAWAHDHSNNPGMGAVFQTLPGSNFTVNGAAPVANSALLSLGGEFRMANNVSFGAKFDGEFASRSQTYTGAATLRYAW